MVLLLIIGCNSTTNGPKLYFWRREKKFVNNYEESSAMNVKSRRFNCKKLTWHFYKTALPRIPTAGRRDFRRYICNSARKAEAHLAALTLREIDMLDNIPDRHCRAQYKVS